LSEEERPYALEQDMISSLCGNCNSVLDELPDTPIERRTPCPSNGSNARRYNVAVEGSLKLYSNLKYKGKRNPFIEGFIGHDLFRKLEKWMRIECVIDRENDFYKEVVTDPATGEEIHRIQDSLNQHIGHGDDKKNRKQ